MASRRDRSRELRELADVLYRLKQEYEATTTNRLKITTPVGSILNHSPEYRARSRSDSRQSRKAQDPSFFAVVEIARQLGVPVCAFTPNVEHQPLTHPQRDVLIRFSRWALANFARRDDERAAYASDFEDFQPYITIRKQSHVLAASPVGTDSQFEPEDADVLAAISGITQERYQVVRVRGDSMAERLHDGDRVLIDITLRSPFNGDMVAVDCGHLGRMIGYWRHERRTFFLDKENAAPVDLGGDGDFTVLGTITRIVDAPLRRRKGHAS